MFLTRLTLDLRGSQARRDLADVYDMHRTLVRAFIAGVDQTPPRFLWSLEAASAWREPTVLVLSEARADWKYLDDQPGYLKRAAETRTQDVSALVLKDAPYRFRLVANPTVTRDGKRRGLVGEDAQLAWLTRQGTQHGFSVDAAFVSGSDMLVGDRKGAGICLQQASFEGRLTVTDEDAFEKALKHGIGPGKAFGCGMLLAHRLA